ncbi:heat shock 90-like protein [Fig virus A]|nr:heat shock 90-like protein [Fig virus A]
MTNVLNPYRWYYGALFREYFGEKMYLSYLSKSETLPTPVITGVKFKYVNGARFLYLQQIENGQPGTFVREVRNLLAILHHLQLPKYCGSTLSTFVMECDVYKGPVSEENTEDATKTLCKFTLNDVSKLMPNGEIGYVRHMWALSNALGELVTDLDVGAYKHVLGGSRALEVMIPTKTYGDYYSECIDTYDMSFVNNPQRHSLRKELIATCVRFLSETYEVVEDWFLKNIIIMGAIQKCCEEKNLFSSGYIATVNAVRVLYSHLVTCVFTPWEWSKVKDIDVRTFVPIEAQEFVVESNCMSLVDNTVILNSVIWKVSEVVQEDALNEIGKVIETLLKVSNPDVSVATLWGCFALYYSIHRTAKQRVERRPNGIRVPWTLKDTSEVDVVEMSGVEEFFDNIQKVNPNINVRKQFLGSIGSSVLNLLKSLNIKLPQISTYKLPEGYEYLYVDFYKQIRRKGLSTDEIKHLTKLRGAVNVMLEERISLRTLNIGQIPTLKIFDTKKERKRI